MDPGNNNLKMQTHFNDRGGIGRFIVQFLKYACVGVIALAADLGLLKLLTSLGLWYIFSVAVSTSVSIFLIFFLNKYWSFQAKQMVGRQLWRYGMLTAGNYVIVIGGVYIFTEYVFHNYMISKLTLAMMQIFWNFFLYKCWVYV